MTMDDLFDDEDDKSETSSKRTYVQPTKKEFEEFLESTPVKWHLNPDANTTELVYDAPKAIPEWTGITLRIYSTIDQRSGKARSKGADAIRLVIWERNIRVPVGGRKKTLRIKTWRKNLREKIESIVNQYSDVIHTCDECGDIMLLKDGKYGEFYGCRSYPSCDYTKDAED